MTSGPMPSEGDVVIRREVRDGKTIFVLATAFRSDQFLLHSQAEAVAHAAAFARQHRVRAWMADGDQRFVMIEAADTPSV